MRANPDNTKQPTQAPDADASPETRAFTPEETAGAHIASLLVDAGYITPEQFAHAKRVHDKLSSERTLVSVLTDLGYANEEQIRSALHTRRIPVPLGTLLVELGYLAEADLKLALAMQREHPEKRLAEVLSENHFIGEHEVFNVLADQLGLQQVSPEEAPVDKTLLRLAPLAICHTNSFFPVRREDHRVVVAFADPLDRHTTDVARKYFGPDLIPAIATRKSVRSAIAHAERTLSDAPTAGGTGAIVDAVNQIINDALSERASDIHFEPMRDRLRIRFRQDGAMIPYKDVSLEMALPIISRVKVMAGADIAERRRHQDGRIRFTVGHSSFDIRVSSYVTIHGEKIVLRLLNNREALLAIKDIGMAPRMLDYLMHDALDAPSGVVLITGPTGAGKTTTLYAAVNYLNDAKTSIITAEDPVEYVIDGISQCSINPKINVSYEETLKHMVRQDPDVMVIGEIRDVFSAEVAINAALTGHKVLTTFHTEDSIGGLLRLLNMNIEAFLISSTVISVVAQRLLRRVCPHCAEDHVLSPHELRRLGYGPGEAEGLTFKRGKGCPACRHFGYRGRLAIFELLVLNERVRDAVLTRKTSYEIRRISTETSGLVTLLEDGITRAALGQTSFEEIIRHLPRMAKPRSPAELRRLLGVRE